MAQQYIYNPKYIEEVSEQVYKAIDSYNNETKINNNIDLENINDNAIQFENINNNFSNINNISERDLLKEKFYNSLTGLGLIILLLLIIYLFNRILFWFIIISFCIFCYNFVTWNFSTSRNQN